MKSPKLYSDCVTYISTDENLFQGYGQLAGADVWEKDSLVKGTESRWLTGFFTTLWHAVRHTVLKNLQKAFVVSWHRVWGCRAMYTQNQWYQHFYWSEIGYLIGNVLFSKSLRKNNSMETWNQVCISRILW